MYAIVSRVLARHIHSPHTTQSSNVSAFCVTVNINNSTMCRMVFHRARNTPNERRRRQKRNRRHRRISTLCSDTCSFLLTIIKNIRLAYASHTASYRIAKSPEVNETRAISRAVTAICQTLEPPPERHDNWWMPNNEMINSAQYSVSFRQILVHSGRFRFGSGDKRIRAAT